MSFTIQHRRDLAANWTLVNPVLASGELGLETDTRKAKMGDGLTAWSGLAYWNPAGTASAVSSVFGRTGAITAQSGDYTAAQVGADASGAAATAQSSAETFATSAVATETTRAEAAEAVLAPLAGAAFTGPVSHTESAAAGGILTVVNSHTTPTSPSVQYAAQTAADLVLGINVTGDTAPRFQIDSNGQMKWGTGSSLDTTLSRASAGAISTNSIRASNSSGSGNILNVVNTNAGVPTAPNVQLFAKNAADLELGIAITGDTQYRLVVDSNGKMSWGTGSAAADTTLFRVSGGTLGTAAMKLNTTAAVGTVLQVINAHSTPSSPNVILAANAAADSELGIQVTGDTVNRLTIDSNGKMLWGPGGSTAGDTDLYRASAGVLQTDTGFKAQYSTAAGLTGAVAASRYVGATTSGAPTTGTFLVGDYVIDQTGYMWICVTAGTPGTWVIGAYEAWMPSDNNLLGATGDGTLYPNTSILTAGTMYMVKIQARQALTVNNLWFGTSINGAGASTGSFAGLYTTAGSLAASTADIGSLFTSGSVTECPLSSAFTFTPGTFYWVALIVNLATTQPTLVRASGNLGPVNAGLTASFLRICVNGTGRTTLPASITTGSNSTSGAVALWVGWS